jgi:signal transduction histidine kinase
MKNKIKKEDMDQLYSLAKMGYLSTGIFHDLINPLNAITLNLNQAKKENKNNNYINNASNAALNMEKLLLSTKEQFIVQDKNINFNLNEELNTTLKLVSYQAKKNQVEIIVNLDKKINIFGPNDKLNRVLVNLLLNAIEACLESKKEKKKILIKAQEKKEIIIIKITDNGCGISKENKNNLFKRFFSTKNGLGIGLCLSKEIIEKYFQGKIKINSQRDKTTFQLEIAKKSKI